MNRILLLFLFVIVFLPITFAQNTTTTLGTIGVINVSYTLVGEITNLNPYSIFVALPDSYIDIEESKNLPTPSDTLYAELSPENETMYYLIKPNETDIFNNKIGFWLPPYTTTKIKLAIYNRNLPIDANLPEEHYFRVITPIVVNNYYEINIKDCFPYYSKEHIKLGKFKLYVNGYVEFNNPGATSIVIPIPIALKDYKNIWILENKNLFVNYYDWYHNFMKTKSHISNDDLNDDDIDDFDPTLSDDDFDDLSIEDRNLPAMAFTVNNGRKIEFYYIMEWDGNKKINLPDII